MRYLLILFIIFSFLILSCSKKGEDDFVITINYELGMHCTGFDFEYCCVLPPYNSIQAQVVKVAKGRNKPLLMDTFDPNDPTVMIDEVTGKRYRLKYEIVDNTFSEGSKMVYWRAKYDMDGDGNYEEPGESVANAYFSHLYIYKDLEGSNPTGTSSDGMKLYIGGPKLQIPEDAGPSGQKLQGYLRNATEKGTIVFTKSPVLDNVPIVLTNPGIWEALGLPVTPFLDSEMAGKPIKTVTEKNIQPYQISQVTLVDAETDEPVIDSRGRIVRYRGTNPIDVPNCSNCHSNKNANENYPEVFNMMKQELDYWKSNGASEWYAQQKATAISILGLHDKKHGTQFTKNYNPTATSNRLGRGSVLCQKCHADNVIGVLASATVKYQKDGTIQVVDMAKIDYARADENPVEYLDPKNPNVPKDGTVIPPLTQAIHYAHQQNRPLPDSKMRSGTCQGCHPAHRQNRSMDGYPITPDGKNAYANADNRDAMGGCYVGRDVHSNKNKDDDGADTPEYLNAIGKWLKENVSREGGEFKGLWCTNCHNQVSRELYKADNLAPGEAFNPDPSHTIRDDSLEEIAQKIGVTVDQLKEMLDPKVKLDKNGKDTGYTLLAWSPDREVAPIAVVATDGKNPIIKKDEDGDINVVILDPNPNNVDKYKDQHGVAAPYDAATHGRDYWLSPGAPHCADCHTPPFVEGQGGVAFPINQPGKYSLMRYSKGHSGLACQSCHESMHGLYPVTPNVDLTTYQQAEALNRDGSHGPLKCQTCHARVNEKGVPLIGQKVKYKGKPITTDYNLAVEWIHAKADDIGGKNPEKEEDFEE